MKILFSCLTTSFFLAAVLNLAGQSKPVPPQTAYYCPLCNSSCDTIAFDKPGTCAHCGMDLVKRTQQERAAELNQKKITVCFYLQNGIEVLDFAGPMEVFSYAGFEVFTVSKTKDPIVSQGILRIIPDYSIADAPPAQILAFFGGNSSHGFDDQVVQWIKSREKTTSYFFSVCTGAFALGKAGLLDGQTATTFHLSLDNLRKSFPKAKVLTDARFVDNGRIITTAGISAGIDGALHMVEKLRGPEAARQAAAYMEYDKWVPGEGVIVKQ